MAFTFNQLVAYNLRRARELRELTQREAAERLQPYLGGEPWSKSNFSGAEHSVDGERIRNFTADDIAAFAQAFDLPILWFLLPPPEDRLRAAAGLGPDDSLRVIAAADADPSTALDPASVVGLAMRMPIEMLERLAEAAQMVPEDIRPQMESLGESVDRLLGDVVQAQIRNAAGGQLDDLRDLAELSKQFAEFVDQVFRHSAAVANEVIKQAAAAAPQEGEADG